MRRPLRSARRAALTALGLVGLGPLLLLALPSSAAFKLLGAASFRADYVLVSQAEDCADAARLARRYFIRAGDRAPKHVVIVVLSDSADLEAPRGAEYAFVGSGVRRNILARWLVLRGHRQSPVLISRPTFFRDRLEWLDPVSLG